MPWRFIKQPNGLFARFSTIVDDVTDYDLTEEEAFMVALEDMGQQEAREKVNRAKLDADPYTDKARPGDGLNRYREAIKTIHAIHGAREADRREGVLGGKPRPKKGRN